MKNYLDAIPANDLRPIPYSPGAFEWNGRPYSLSTDGHRAMIVEGHHVPVQDVPTEPMQRWLAPIESKSCALADLIAALRVHAEPGDCTTCKNAREIDAPVEIDCHECDGEGMAECGECGHESQCKHCKGTGKVKSTKTKKVPCACVRAARPVTLGISKINLRLLLPVLEQLPDQPIRWGHLGGQFDAMRIDGEGWHFLLMPMNISEPAPTVEIGGAK